MPRLLTALDRDRVRARRRIVVVLVRAGRLARSLFRKGADFTAATAFEIASTNLVVELGIVMALLLGWQFVSIGNVPLAAVPGTEGSASAASCRSCSPTS